MRRLCLLALAGLILSACAPAATPAPAPTTAPAEVVQTQVVEQPRTQTAAPTNAPAPTGAPSAGAADTQSAPPPTATIPVQPPPTQPALPTEAPAVSAEARWVELEWPRRLRLGDSDSVRVALVPAEGGYVVATEFPDNVVVTQTVSLPRPGGYSLFAAARLAGVGFAIAPEAEQESLVPLGEAVTWRWTVTPHSAGRHRLTLDLWLRWVPAPGGAAAAPRESQLLSRSLTVEVVSLFGLTPGQAAWLGVLGLVLGGGLSVAALTTGRRRPRPAPPPNTALAVEPPPHLTFAAEERGLLQVLFRRYARVVIESEFRSGYSGARTLLALPVRPDGRADAHTIVKIGERRAIEREHQNYEAYVKDTLPPMTARIQEPPVLPPPAVAVRRLGGVAALRYTFIAEPGQRPLSLREALLRDPDPALLVKLFETFGPNWWLQRRPHTFRLAQEYDRLLPAHLVLEPAPAAGPAAVEVGPGAAPGSLPLKAGDLVRVGRFPEWELRQDGRSLSLTGAAQAGQPALRLRWLGLLAPDGTPARVIATRALLLREAVAGLDLLGLPDPLARLPDLLNETVAGSQSVIHGDLNLENVLVGPGGFVWLIDFAQTRDGHPLFDFAHLTAEIVAHVIAPQVAEPHAYLDLWAAGQGPAALSALLAALRDQAARCLVNPVQPREYHLALYAACLGALKHSTLDRHARHLLYVTAAAVARGL